MIPRHRPSFHLAAAISGVMASLRSPAAEELEDLFREAYDIEEAVLLPSARAGICWALVAAGGRKVEALTTAYTCSVVHEAIVRSEARLRTFDIEPRRFLIDEKLLASQTSAESVLVLCEIYGHPYDLDSLLCLAPKTALRIVDMAMTVPSKGVLRRLNARDVAILSFGIGKCVYAGWGGMAVTKDRALASEMRALRASRLEVAPRSLTIKRALSILTRTLAHEPLVYRAARQRQESRRRTDVDGPSPRGMEVWANDRRIPQEWRLPSTRVDRGFIARLLKNLDWNEARRLSLAGGYRKMLHGVPGLVHPPESPFALSHYTVRVPGEQRETIRRILWDKGIDTGTLFSLPSYLEPDAFPNSFRTGSEILNLPLNLDMSDRDLQRVTEALIKAVRASVP